LFRNGTLRVIFRTQIDDTIRLCEDLRRSSPNIITLIKPRIRLPTNVQSKEERRNDYRVLDGRRVGKRHLGRLRHKYEDNIKMDVKDKE